MVKISPRTEEDKDRYLKQNKTQDSSKLKKKSPPPRKTQAGRYCKIHGVLIELFFFFLPLVIYGHFPPSIDHIFKSKPH